MHQIKNYLEIFIKMKLYVCIFFPSPSKINLKIFFSIIFKIIHINIMFVKYFKIFELNFNYLTLINQNYLKN